MRIAKVFLTVSGRHCVRQETRFNEAMMVDAASNGRALRRRPICQILSARSDENRAAPTLISRPICRRPVRRTARYGTGKELT